MIKYQFWCQICGKEIARPKDATLGYYCENCKLNLNGWGVDEEKGRKMTKLKPCPFCGKDASVRCTERQLVVWCNHCPAGVADYTVSEEELIKAWNRREGKEDERQG